MPGIVKYLINSEFYILMSHWCYLTLWISNPYLYSPPSLDCSHASIFHFPRYGMAPASDIQTLHHWLWPRYQYWIPMAKLSPFKQPSSLPCNFTGSGSNPLSPLLAAWQAWPRDLTLQIYSSSLQLLWKQLVCFQRTNSPRAAQYSPDC